MLTDPYQGLFTEIVAVYWFTELSNCAVYVAPVVAATGVGLQFQLNE